MRPCTMYCLGRWASWASAKKSFMAATREMIAEGSCQRAATEYLLCQADDAEAGRVAYQPGTRRNCSFIRMHPSVLSLTGDSEIRSDVRCCFDGQDRTH